MLPYRMRGPAFLLLARAATLSRFLRLIHRCGRGGTPGGSAEPLGTFVFGTLEGFCRLLDRSDT
jgi:hypothetical protein